MTSGAIIITDESAAITVGPRPVIRGGWGFGGKGVSKGANRAISSAVVSTNFFAKANLYVNSRLPAHLPPLKMSSVLPPWLFLQFAKIGLLTDIYHRFL